MQIDIYKNIKRMRDKAISLRAYSTWILIGAIITAIVLASVVTYVLNYFLKIELILSVEWWIVLIGVVVGGIMTIFLSRALSHPIKELDLAMRRVAKGDFESRVEYRGRVREVRDVCAGFNLMADELGSTEILQTDFVSNVSHEFKTPLGAIEGYATLLQDKYVSDEERELYIERILMNTQRMSGLVGNILLLSKLDNRTIADKTVSFRLDEQLRGSVVLLEPKWSRKEIEFDIDLPRVEYEGAEGLLNHVWNNLLGNAIKFAPQKSTVRIELLDAAASVTVRISDEGPGISEGAMEHIFDRFYQSDSSHKEERNGLGLSLVKRIVDGSGGKVFCENLDTGGCMFTVILPR